MERVIRTVALTWALLFVFGAGSGLAQGSSNLKHQSVVEVLAMVDAGLGEGVILARVEKIGVFPELNGSDLAALAERGVPEAVLIRLVELGSGQLPEPEPVPEPEPAPPSPPQPPVAQPGPAPAAPSPPQPPVAQPAPAPAAPAVPAAEGLGKPAPAAAAIRVEVDRPFAVTYLEVVVDGQQVTSHGELWQGESEAGQRLKRPYVVKLGKHFTAAEVEVVPGEHQVLVGFAVTQVAEDPNDEWGEYAVESYQNRGVRTTGEADPDHGWFANQAAICSLKADQTCLVTARLDRHSPTRLGGIPDYSVGYTVELKASTN